MKNTGRLSLFLYIFFIYIQAMHTNIRSRGYLCFMYFMQYACSHRPSEYSGCQHKYPPCITFLHTIEVLPASMYTDGSPLLSMAVQGSHQRLCKIYRRQRKNQKIKVPVVPVRQIQYVLAGAGAIIGGQRYLVK
jgi:hypothetical protein